MDGAQHLCETLRRLLSDGEIHTLGYLHANTRALIRPESAVRIYQRQSSNPNRLPLEQQVERGEVAIIRHALFLIGAESLDGRRQGWTVRFRLDRARLPWRQCQTCGLDFVAN